MLSNEALNSALPLTSVLDAAGFKLTPIPGTPLERLVQATRSDDNFNIATDVAGVTEYQPSLSDIEYIANCKDDVLQVSPHDTVMDDVTEIGIAAVREHMVFARTVVAPAVQNLVENVAETLNAITPSSLLGMEVVVWEPAAPLQNNALENMVRRFENTPFDSPSMAMRCPSITVAEMIELMKTGSNSMDKDIEAWAASKGESFFINIWENVFQIKQAELNERVPVTFRDFTENRESGPDNALAIFLLSRRLLDDPLPETTMDMKMYSNMMADYRNQAGARVCRALDELENIGKSQLLVRSVNGPVTTVYSFVYRKWIEAGGSNEILFGNLLESPFSSTVEMLNAKAESLKAKWARHAALTATVEANRKFVRTKEALLDHFIKQMREVDEGGIEAGSLGNREIVIRKFRELLDDVTDDELKDLWTVSLKLVCRSRFARTDAERILAGIEQVKRDHPELDVREAAAMSVLKYVAYWLTAQYKVEPISA